SALPATIAHVWRCPSSRIQGTRATVSSPLSAWVPRGGSRYSASHTISHRNPTDPVMMKAQRHPQVSAIHGTTSGVTIAPVLVPALKIPVARARSSLGNHSATVLMAPGKLADSPRPSIARAAENAAVVRANACPMAATLHTITAVAEAPRTPPPAGHPP